MVRKKNTQYKNLSSESAESPSFPTTPQHQTLLDNILSSPPTNTLLKTGIQVTPNKLSRALTKILAEKPMPINSHKQAAMTNLLERLSSLRSQQQHTLDQPRNKRIKIEAAPDGSAALVISSSSTQPNPHSSHHHYYHRHHHNKQQLPHPTTIAPASLFSSPSSSSSLHHPILSSAEINQHSPLVSATTPEYGRVIMKKEALINKLGFQAAQRAIRRANSQRKPPYPRVDRSSNHPSSSSASSPPSSPQTWRTGTIGKWLESADEEDEDQEQHYHHFSRARDLTLSKLVRESRPSGSAAHRPTDPQSLFWSPVKTRKSPSSTRRPLSHSDSLLSSHDHHHQQLMDRLGRMDALEMGSDTTRWPINRPITPPNQRSFFHSDDWSHYQLPRPGGPQDRPDLYGPFSQLSFASHSSPGGPSFQGMLKPGCNLNQAFLVLAPSPKTQLSESNNDENRRPEIAAPPSATAKLDRPPARNDYSPCSPLRSDWRKLMEQHHFPGRLESPNPSKLRALPKPSPASPEMVDQRWLAGLDSNRLPNPPSSPPFPDDGLLNLDHFPASKSNDPLDDFLDLF